jgi:hypothetical protein
MAKSKRKPNPKRGGRSCTASGTEQNRPAKVGYLAMGYQADPDPWASCETGASTL